MSALLQLAVAIGYRDGWNDCRDEMLHSVKTLATQRTGDCAVCTLGIPGLCYCSPAAPDEPQAPSSADDCLRGRYVQHLMPTLGVTFVQPPSAASAPPDSTVHSCSYFCELPACVKQQRDEFRDEMASPAMPASSAGLLHLWEMPTHFMPLPLPPTGTAPRPPSSGGST